MKTIAGWMFLKVFLCLLLVDHANAVIHRMKAVAGNTSDLHKMSGGARGQRRSTNSGLKPNTSRHLKQSDGGRARNKMKKALKATYVPTTSPTSSSDDMSTTSTPRPTPRPPAGDGFSWFPPTLPPNTFPSAQLPTTLSPVVDSGAGEPTLPLPSTTPIDNGQQPQPSSSPLAVASSQTLSPSTSTETRAIDKSTFADPQTGALDTSLTCREPIPNGAFGETDQLITYDYILNVMPGTIVSVVLAEIEQLIQDELAKDFLNCSFTASSFGEGEDAPPSFFVYELHTAPTDQLTGGCLDEERLYDAECYQITGFMRAIIFYLPTTLSSTTTSVSAMTSTAAAHSNSNNHDPRLGQHRPGERRRRRFLASEIEDPQVLAAFEAWFQDFFASDTIFNVNSRVAGFKFAGITNEYQPPPPEPEDRTGIIVGGVLAGCVGVILVAAALTYGIRKRHRKAEKEFYKEAMDYVDNELDSDDDDNNIGFDARSTASQKRREVVVVGEDETVLSGLPVVLVEDGARDAEDIRRDLSNMEIMHGYSTNLDGTRFLSSARPPEHLQPSVSNDQQQASMLEATRKDLGPRRSEKAKSRRSYGMKNTVEL